MFLVNPNKGARLASWGASLTGIVPNAGSIPAASIGSGRTGEGTGLWRQRRGFDSLLPDSPYIDLNDNFHCDMSHSIEVKI